MSMYVAKALHTYRSFWTHLSHSWFQILFTNKNGCPFPTEKQTISCWSFLFASFGRRIINIERTWFTCAFTSIVNVVINRSIDSVPFFSAFNYLWLINYGNERKKITTNRSDNDLLLRNGICFCLFMSTSLNCRIFRQTVTFNTSFLWL